MAYIRFGYKNECVVDGGVDVQKCNLNRAAPCYSLKFKHLLRIYNTVAYTHGFIERDGEKEWGELKSYWYTTTTDKWTYSFANELKK